MRRLGHEPSNRLHRRPDRLPGPWRPLTALIAAVLVLLFVAEPLRVSSDSMAPTFRQGDRIVIDKLTIHLRPPSVNDLIVFDEPGPGGLAVKRVVAVGGQAVALEDGRLVVDGVDVDAVDAPLESVDSVYFGPVIVPPHHLFVLGDARGASVDSRDYGAVPLEEVVGRVLLRMWPPVRF